MHRKNVLFAQEGLTSFERLSKAVATLDAEFVSCAAKDLPAFADGVDLVVFNVDSSRAEKLDELEKTLSQIGVGTCFLVVEEDALRTLRMPSHMSVDFCLASAGEDEIAVRLRHLLWPGEETSSADFVTVGSMTINLSTYQVQVDGQPVDFTYLEYALLAFLVTHPGHAYSRDALLRRVWGFEYYGGSRTVDVHVRRVRSKLGSDLASRLETVRGVGYMWSM